MSKKMLRDFRDLLPIGQLAGLAALLAVSAAAQTSSNPRPNPSRNIDQGRQFLGLGPAPDREAAARGEKLFAQNCGFCHGADARGGEGPNLVRSTVVLHDEHGNQVGPVVRNGRPDRGMPAFPSFTNEQLRDIAEFLHARVDAAANRFGYKILNVVTGNATEGRTFFEQNCTGCHSPEKDLAHIASRYEPQDLQSQFLYPSPRNRDDQRTATVSCDDGTQISGKIKSIDDFHIAIVTADGEFRSFASNSVKISIHDPLEGHRQLLAKYTNTDMHNVLAYLETLK